MHWLLNSSIGKKLIMSVSGIFLVLFLLFHMSMNLVLIFSSEIYNMICEALGASWYAIVGTLILAIGMFIHILYGTYLTYQNKRARGSDRYLADSKTKIDWTSQNMFVLGLIILLGLVIHLFNFWAKMQFSELFHFKNTVKEGSILVIGLFSNPIYSCIYIGWLVAIWFHLTHGIWSAFQTIGWNGKNWFLRLRYISNIIATLILIGFSAVPIYFMICSLIKF